MLAGFEKYRDSDTISRQGGDEFLIVLTELPDADAAAPILVKVMERLEEVFHTDGQDLFTSVSMGIAIYPDDGRDFATVLKKADTAMYRAKEAGRNTYRFFDDHMNVDAVENLSTRSGLRRALEQGEFVLHYQPQIDLTSGTMIGAVKGIGRRLVDRHRDRLGGRVAVKTGMNGDGFGAHDGLG